MNAASPPSPAPTPKAAPGSARLALSYLLDILPTILTPFVGIAAALGLIVLILNWQGADAQIAWKYLYEGTLQTAAKRADMVAYWMPLAITSFGLVLTYTAGLWNIGVEGQIIMGAVGATYAVRLFTTESSSPLINLGVFQLAGVLLICVMLLWTGYHLITTGQRARVQFYGLIVMLIAAYVSLLFLEVVFRKLNANVLLMAFIFAALSGGLWASVAAVLKTRAGVNEIFGGVALNFVAQTFNLYLISNGGPWQPPGSRATETARFPEVARLPSLENYRRLSPTTIYITIGAFIVVALIMYVSRWGLQLRAMGKNRRSAFLLGVHTERNIILSMLMCGSLAGLAGAFRVLAPDVIKLTAAPSGGIGFLAILVVLLASMSAILTSFVSFVFAVLSKGGQSIESRFMWEHDILLDRSLVRVLQSTVVLMVVLAFGVRNRFFASRRVQPVDEDDEVART